MPEESPPALARLASSTNRSPRLTRISGNIVSRSAYDEWCEVAALPDNRPVLARTNEPLHTDMTTSAVLAELRIHPFAFSLALLCAGITKTFGAGAFRIV